MIPFFVWTSRARSGHSSQTYEIRNDESDAEQLAHRHKTLSRSNIPCLPKRDSFGARGRSQERIYQKKSQQATKMIVSAPLWCAVWEATAKKLILAATSAISAADRRETSRGVNQSQTKIAVVAKLPVRQRTRPAPPPNGSGRLDRSVRTAEAGQRFWPFEFLRHRTTDTASMEQPSHFKRRVANRQKSPLYRSAPPRGETRPPG